MRRRSCRDATSGWLVTYHGALHGFEDLGRDLICIKDKIVEIVQAKCWSKSKVIHEKHLFQLFLCLLLLVFIVVVMGRHKQERLMAFANKCTNHLFHRKNID